MWKLHFYVVIHQMADFLTELKNVSFKYVAINFLCAEIIYSNPLFGVVNLLFGSV